MVRVGCYSEGWRGLDVIERVRYHGKGWISW